MVPKQRRLNYLAYARVLNLANRLQTPILQVTNNTKALMALDQLLLERLSANTGNLLDDEELIGGYTFTPLTTAHLAKGLHSIRSIFEYIFVTHRLSERVPSRKRSYSMMGPNTQIDELPNFCSRSRSAPF